MKTVKHIVEIGFSYLGCLPCQNFPVIKDHKFVRILESLDGNFRKGKDL
jgi:hypothetical protein